MTPIDSTQTPAAKTHWPSIIQLGLSLFALLSLWGIALVSWQSALIQYFNPSFDTALSIASTSNALGIFLLGVLLLPSAGFSLLRIVGRSDLSNQLTDKANRFVRPGWLIALLPIILLTGFWAAGQDNWALALLPPLLVLGVALPVLWLLWLGKRALPSGSPQQQWGLFAAGLTLGPFIIVLLEIFFLVVIVIVAVFTSSALFLQFGDLITVGPSSFSADPERIEEIAAQVISQPGVIAVILMFLSGIVPLIEELVKPIGVWLLAGRKLAPAEGFSAGLISGAAFALFETITQAPEPDSWVLFVIVRIGTATMHIFNSGLMGWAIASAFTEKRYFRLIAVYPLVVIIHGLWNAAAVFLNVALLNQFTDTGLSFPSHFIISAPIFLLYLTLAAFTLIVYINRRFNRAQETALAPSKESA